jgi:hypothetical protein
VEDVRQEVVHWLEGELVFAGQEAGDGLEVWTEGAARTVARHGSAIPGMAAGAAFPPQLEFGDLGFDFWDLGYLPALQVQARGAREIETTVGACLEIRFGNTSAASILIAAATARVQGRLLPGFTVMAAFGAGMSWGSALLWVR